MAVGTVSTTNFAAALKELYPQKRVNQLFYKKHPFLAMLQKKSDFFGLDDGLKITVQHGVPQGRSATFSNAQTNATTGNEVKFSLTRKSDYVVVKLTTESIEASSNNIGALISALQNKLDGGMKSLGRNLSAMLYGNGGGARGRLAAGAAVGTPTVALANPNDVVFFEVDQVIVASDTDGTSGAPRAGSVTIAKVDRSAGTLTATGNWTAGIAAIDSVGPDTDYLFVQGDFGNMITGLNGWVPASAPGATLFFGVDRSTDTDRLGGVRYSATTLPIEEAGKQLAARLVRMEASPDVWFLNPMDFVNLEIGLEERVRYNDIKSQHAGVGFEGIVLTTGAGKVKVLSDTDCPQGTGFMLQMDTWTFHHLKEVPHAIMVGDTTKLRTIENADAVEFRAVYRGNLACDAPGWNGRVALAS